MKILVLSFYYEPDLCAGSFRASEFVKELGSHEVYIDVISTMPNRYASHKVDASSSEVHDNLRIRRVKIPAHSSGIFSQSYAFLFYFFNVIKYSKEEEYDAVYATSSRLFTAYLGFIVSRWKGVPLYLDIRDLFVDTLFDLFPNLIARPLVYVLRVFERVTFNHAKHINLVSPGFSSYFRNRFKCKSYSFYTNGIDEIFLDLQMPKRNERNRKKVLYAGNIGDGQALHKIIPPLAKRRPDFDFLIVGDGGKKRQLQAMTSDVANVSIEPACSRERLLDYYRDADVLLVHLNSLRSFEKVLPSKIFEYSAMNKPIIAGLSGFSREFVVSEVQNAEVFSPCCDAEAALALDNLEFKTPINRASFIAKYRRNLIMKSLARSVINVVGR